jgi:hypothetical protein
VRGRGERCRRQQQHGGPSAGLSRGAIHRGIKT